MLRPPIEALRRRLVESSAVVLVLAVAMVLPVVLGLSALELRLYADKWLAGYRPVVYLAVEATEADTLALAEELESWPEVREARLRPAAEALEALTARLGAEHISQMGLGADMLPTSLVLEPEDAVAGHIDLVARVAGLEARPLVESVDIPSSRAVVTLRAARNILVASVVLSATLFASALVVLVGFLRALQRAESPEMSLLEIFGAPADLLGRATMLRGMTLGIWSGSLAGVGLGILLRLWEATGGGLLNGLAPTSHWGWLMVLACIAGGPVLGLGAGWLATRAWRTPSTAEGAAPSLLRWQN